MGERGVGATIGKRRGQQNRAIRDAPPGAYGIRGGKVTPLWEWGPRGVGAFFERGEADTWPARTGRGCTGTPQKITSGQSRLSYFQRDRTTGKVLEITKADKGEQKEGGTRAGDFQPKKVMTARTGAGQLMKLELIRSRPAKLSDICRRGRTLT